MAKSAMTRTLMHTTDTTMITMTTTVTTTDAVTVASPAAAATLGAPTIDLAVATGAPLSGALASCLYAAVLTDMAKQLEEALKRPAAPVRPPEPPPPPPEPTPPEP